MKERPRSQLSLGRISRQYRYLRGRSQYSRSLVVLNVVLNVVLKHESVSLCSLWLLYQVEDHRSHHVQWATTAAVSLAWGNGSESGITFSKSKDERRGIPSALHQSRATQIVMRRAQESKPARQGGQYGAKVYLRVNSPKGKQLTRDAKISTSITTAVEYTCAQKRNSYEIKVLPSRPCFLVEDSG